jgi:hypothetical protein
MTEQNQQKQRRPIINSLKAIVETIEIIKENKKDIERIINNPIFKESFFEMFHVGSFSSASKASDEGKFMVAMEPVPFSENWQAVFYLKKRESITWRKANVAEIISCWEQYYPLLEKLMHAENANIGRVDRAISRLKNELAVEIMTKSLDSGLKISL